MKNWSLVALMIGLALLAGVVVYDGLGSIAAVLGACGFLGLLAILSWRSLVIAVMGCTWWCLGRGLLRASPGAYIWGRFARDSASAPLMLASSAWHCRS